MFALSHLRSLLELPRAQSDEERRALWRQSMATLARASLEQVPVPLEGLDPAHLLEAVRAVFKFGLLDDLAWLSPPGAAAAIYQLASALPVGPERRQLGRRVLTRLYEGDAETFVVLATSLAAESKRMLTGAPIRARLALALELPLGGSMRIDALSLVLISRPELRREWLNEPATGSLPSRRLAARLLERAARESARLAAQGDHSSLAVYAEPSVRAAWTLLLADRESLVWRHIATARGLLYRAIPELGEEMEAQLDPKLTPTEWRRAAVSLAASIAVDPQAGLMRCKALLASATYRADPGLIETMIFGLGRAAEVEPEAVEDLLEQIARQGGIEAAEALVDLRRERTDSELGVRAALQAQEKLKKWLATQRFDDDGRIALCEVLSEELGEPKPNLRSALDRALRAFAERDARNAVHEAQAAFQVAGARLTELELCSEEHPGGRRTAFRIMRELDSSLLESAALTDLMTMSGTSELNTSTLTQLFERLTVWLVRLEQRPVQNTGAVPHLSLRMRRLRTLLHLIDAEGSYGEDPTGQRRTRQLRVARMLLGRARNDAPSPLRRIVCAALARTLDALVRDEVCELSDVLVAVADNVAHVHDVSTVAEASMLPDCQRSLSGYAALIRACDKSEPSGRNVRTAIDALRHLALGFPWASTPRVGAMRAQLLALARRLEDIAAARTLSELATGPGHDQLLGLEAVIASLAQLIRGARRRLIPRPTTQGSLEQSGLSALVVAVERAPREGSQPVADALEPLTGALEDALLPAIARTVLMVLQRMSEQPVSDASRRANSFSAAQPKDAPLPPWLTGRRTIGGFYVLHPLGRGGVGSVFVVTRVEERHQGDATRFALKVPDYTAEAARTLSEEEFLNLFREEAGALLALPQHRNLATFVTFDAGARPKPILVMELVEGPTLERVIERGDLNVEQALDLLDGIAAGLLTMHSAGIGHLDVKPSNVILRHADNDQRDEQTPVLVDFGLAGRHLRPGCATGPYGAPEIWGLVPPDYEAQPMNADVYAYSCLAYEVLTGDTLFEGASELAIVHAHVSHDGFPEKLRALCAKKGMQTLGELIGNGLRRHPGERISVQEMREGFQELRQSLSKLEWPLRAA